MNISPKYLMPTLTLGFCVIACTPLKSSRTIALPGLPPIKDAGQVRVVKELKDASQPYQIVGKVTTYREGTKITEGGSIRRMCGYAAEMGADGIIGLHRNAGGGLYSALAVKWLAPGEKPQPLNLPFMVAVLPVEFGPSPPPKTDRYQTMIRAQLDYALETKGYYLMPGLAGGCPGGIARAKTLDGNALAAIGGKDSQALTEVSFVTHTGGIYSGQASIRAVLFDKRTRKLIHDSHGSGSVNAGDVFFATGMSPLGAVVLPLFMPNALREDAAVRGAIAAFKDLKPIHQKTGR